MAPMPEAIFWIVSRYDYCFIEALSIERSRDSDNVAERKTVRQIAKYS